MDNLTHSLTGVLLSRAGLNRVHPRATLIMFLSANMPDMDAVSFVGGVPLYLLWHRGYTHAFAMLPLVALIPTIFVRLVFFKEQFNWLRAWLLSAIGVLSHVLLDFTNPYGIRLLLPFSNEWPRLSITNVVDFWIWLFLVSAFVWPALSRLVSDEIGARRPRGQGLAIAALCSVLAYDTARYFLHAKAVEAQQGRLISGATPRRAFAIPDNINPFRWKGIVETDTFYAIQTVDLTAEEPLSDTPRVQYKPVASKPIEAAAQTWLFQTFTKFTPAFLWQTTPEPTVEGATLVEAIDLQLGLVASAVVDSQNQVVSMSLRFP